MPTRSAGAMLRAAVLTVLFGFGVATGVAMSAAAAPDTTDPCVTNIRAAPVAVTPTPTQSAPAAPLRPGPSPF